MATLHLVLAESALERVPEELWSHPSVSKSARARAKRPGELLLEDTYHHSAMRQAAKKGRFPDAERRGRPDIVHFSLLVALESRLNQERRLQAWVHTYDDRLIRLDPEVRLQRAQHRFSGLMEHLLQEGVVPLPDKGPALMTVQDNVPLAQAVRATGATQVIVLDETGDEDDTLEAAFSETDGDIAAVVGGFPRGRLQSDLNDLPHKTIRLGREPLPAWSVTAELTVRYRQATTKKP